MKTSKPIFFFIISIICVSLSNCKPEEILSGELSGNVYDILDLKPVPDVKVLLNPLDDSVITASDGKFLFSNLDPGKYVVQVTKQAYLKQSKNVEIFSATNTLINFTLDGAPIPKLSDKSLDFGLDSTVKFLLVSNIGNSTLKYSITANQGWITVFPFSGEVKDETDTLKVIINKTGLSNDIQKGEIQIELTIGQEVQRETVNILVNGLMDSDLNYYKVVKIGTQIWMAENLNTGIMINSALEQTDFQVIKKYCYGNDDRSCKIFGGLYQWPEMMRGANSDSANIGTTRGICPVGWHIPTMNEWITLIDYLSEPVAGIKLKEAGTVHWAAGNVADNESGFTALPGGMWDGFGFGLMTTHEYIWTATADKLLESYYSTQFGHNSQKVFFPKYQGKEAVAVRCLKD